MIQSKTIQMMKLPLQGPIKQKGEPRLHRKVPEPGLLNTINPLHTNPWDRVQFKSFAQVLGWPPRLKERRPQMSKEAERERAAKELKEVAVYRYAHMEA